MNINIKCEITQCTSIRTYRKFTLDSSSFLLDLNPITGDVSVQHCIDMGGDVLNNNWNRKLLQPEAMRGNATKKIN